GCAPRVHPPTPLPGQLVPPPRHQAPGGPAVDAPEGPPTGQCLVAPLTSARFRGTLRHARPSAPLFVPPTLPGPARTPGTAEGGMRETQPHRCGHPDGPRGPPRRRSLRRRHRGRGTLAPVRGGTGGRRPHGPARAATGRARLLDT